MSDERDLWHQNTFDHRSPRRIELSGQGVVKGLIALWARHLYVTVQPTGITDFVRSIVNDLDGDLIVSEAVKSGAKNDFLIALNHVDES